MGKHCVYCKSQLEENSVIDVCRRCGIGIWGEKMFSTIVGNMENADKDGDLNQGLVTISAQSKPFLRQQRNLQQTSFGSSPKSLINQVQSQREFPNNQIEIIEIDPTKEFFPS